VRIVLTRSADARESRVGLRNRLSELSSLRELSYEEGVSNRYEMPGHTLFVVDTSGRTDDDVAFLGVIGWRGATLRLYIRIGGMP
jgi:hypothetical protein